jgi:hypothetical protein
MNRGRLLSSLPRVLASTTAVSCAAGLRKPGHPRLYFEQFDLGRLRGLRKSGVHRLIWTNLRRSAEECLERSPRRAWIAPKTPDPVYENLYDRFYAIMGDLAITEHLAFAYALCGEERFGRAARSWTLASARAWRSEAEGTPDGGKAYAVARLLKGIAVGYDCAYDRFTPAELSEVRTTLSQIAERYYNEYFSTPTISGPTFHTHHAVVEWASFGVAALTLLGEVDAAATWVDAATRKFEDHLLPHGLAPDGAQVEGATFWASTMQYRLFYMDPLRRVTGKDLFPRFRREMSGDLALAAVAARHRGRYGAEHESVVLELSYGQLDYYSPVLLALAREYRRPVFQELALWDETLGGLQHSRYITPSGEQLLFEMGGYAYLWADPTVTPSADEEMKSFRFPSVGEAYARRSWVPSDLMVALRKGSPVLHGAGTAAVIEASPPTEGAPEWQRARLADDGHLARIWSSRGESDRIELTLDRARAASVLRRTGREPWQWWCHGKPDRSGNTLRWPRKAELKVTRGEITHFEPEGYAPRHAVGNGLLLLRDPAPRSYPLVKASPAPDGVLELELRLLG